MAKTNKPSLKTRGRTHEGSPAYAFEDLTPEQALRRSVLACFLWEDSFYEDGISIADRIAESCKKVKLDTLANLAIEAREDYKLRHAPLLLLREMTRLHSGNRVIGDTITRVIQRADELTEFLALYWKDNKQPLSAQTKRGLAKAFEKFDEYQLAKYNRKGAIQLCDVMALVRPKPKTKEREALYKRLANNTLHTPDTWEVSLSSGMDKKETFERLLKEEKLGYLALLRNLRNMEEAKVDPSLIKDAIHARKGADRVLPFRYIAAARSCPHYENELDTALLYSLQHLPQFMGKTVVLVDVSGSMHSHISCRSKTTGIAIAAALASIICGEDIRTFTFSNRLVEIPHRLGMAGVDAIENSQEWGATNFHPAVEWLNKNIDYDRLIVLTDEQAHDFKRGMQGPKTRGYVINIASYKNGVGYGPWIHVDGFSEATIKYINALENINITFF